MERYLEDAYGLIEIAEELRVKARAKPALVHETHYADDESSSRWVIEQRPETRLDDVAGLEEVKEVVRDTIILPLRKPDVYERFRVRPGGGVLMYGPPGNGKTYIARAIAGELDAAFIAVDLAAVKSKYVGDTAKNLRSIFDEALRHDSAVIFLDEVDALLSRRGNRRVDSVPQFLMLTDGLVKTERCLLLLGATNQPWTLDDAVLRPGRLGIHLYVGPPDAEAREGILAIHMRGAPMAEDVSFPDIASKTEGYSGADVAAVCHSAKMMAIKRQIATGNDEQVTQTDLLKALEVIAPSTSPALLEDFERWRKLRARPSEDDEQD